MRERTPKEKSIERLVRKHLNEFPLYSENQSVHVFCYPEDISVGYHPSGHSIPLMEKTHFGLQIIESICYIITISIEEGQRRKGYGTRLYHCIKNFAQEQGCARIRTTPSGYGAGFWPKMGFEECGKLEAEVVLEQAIFS